MGQRIASSAPPGVEPLDEPAPEGETVTEMLHDLTEGGEGKLTAQTLVEHLGRSGFGPLLLALGVPQLAPLPPGTPIIFALPLLIICLQMIAGREKVWLPDWLRDKGFEREKLAKLVKKVIPPVAGVERHLKTRLTFMVDGFGERMIGVTCTLVAVVLVLPVPFANFVPSAAITAFGLALARRDGLLAILGYILVILAIFVVWLCLHFAAMGYHHLIRHFFHHVVGV